MVCEKEWDYEVPPGQSMYGAAYIIGARHEQTVIHDPRPEGKGVDERCFLNAARHIELIGVE